MVAMTVFYLQTLLITYVKLFAANMFDTDTGFSGIRMNMLRICVRRSTQKSRHIDQQDLPRAGRDFWYQSQLWGDWRRGAPHIEHKDSFL